MADIETEITELITRIATRQRQRMTAVDDDFDLGGLTPHQARIVGFIEAGEASGVIARDIADVTGARAASVSALLAGLEADGWVERHVDPSDSRRKTLHVTPKARALVKRFEAGVRARGRVQLSALTPDEREQLRTLLTKLDKVLTA
jgi:DNA-binding MarR family transcriptional regulator